MNMNGRRLFRMLNALIMEGSEALFPGSTVSMTSNNSTTTEASPTSTSYSLQSADTRVAESLAEKLIAGKLKTNQVPPRVRWEVLQILNKKIMTDKMQY